MPCMRVRANRRRSEWRRESVVRVLALAGVLLVTPVANGAPGVATAFAIQERADLRPAIIHGDVRRASENGDAAPSVDVWATAVATGMEVSRDQTDGDGRFTLTVPPGRYSVISRRPGYLQANYGSMHYGLPGSPLVVGAGQRVNIRIVVHRAPAVLGVVRDDVLRPISNATVDILQPSTLGGPERRVVSRTTTDVSGAYRVDDLVPGEYLAVAKPPRPSAAGSGPIQLQTPAAQYYPGSDAEDGAERLRLNANEERAGVDFTLPRRPLTRLAGVVVPPENVRLVDDVMAIVTGAGDSPPTWGRAPDSRWPQYPPAPASGPLPRRHPGDREPHRPAAATRWAAVRRLGGDRG